MLFGFININTIFYIQLISSFIVGGVFIALQTLIGERVSPFFRGVVLTVPSTMAIGLLFIAITKDANQIGEATVMIPITASISYLFFVVFAYFSYWGFFKAFSLSLIVWFIGAFLALKFQPSSFQISALEGLSIVLISYLATLKLPKNISFKKYPMNFKHISTRSIFSGLVIVVAVLLAKTLNNAWGGTFSTFPAVFSSTITIYYFLQGRQAIASVARTLFFPGAFVIMIYPFLISILYPSWGILWGTIASYTGIIIFLFVWYGTKMLLTRALRSL